MSEADLFAADVWHDASRELPPIAEPDAELSELDRDLGMGPSGESIEVLACMPGVGLTVAVYLHPSARWFCSGRNREVRVSHWRRLPPGPVGVPLWRDLFQSAPAAPPQGPEGA